MQDLGVYELLERLSNVLRAQEREEGLEERLQPAQLSALLYLVRCNRYSDTPAAVTDYLGVTKGTASQTLIALERRGLLVKRSDPEDGRVTRLGLTTAGRKLVEDIVPPRPFRDALSEFEPPQAEQLEGALQALLGRLLRARGARSFGVCRTCRFFERESRGGFRCGLTGETLTKSDAGLICREHESPAEPA